MVHIQNTNDVGIIEVSESLLKEVEEKPSLEILKELRPMEFDQNNNIVPIKKHSEVLNK